MFHIIFFLIGVLISLLNIVLFTYKRNRMSQIYAKERVKFGYILLITVTGFGVFAFSECIEIFGLITNQINVIIEISQLAGSIILLGQIIITVIIVRNK